MPRTKLTDEERRNREAERKQTRRAAQREEARRRTLAEASATAHVRVLESSDPASAAITASRIATAPADREDEGPGGIASGALSGEQSTASVPPGGGSPEAGDLVVGSRYNFRPRSSASPPTAEARTVTAPTTGSPRAAVTLALRQRAERGSDAATGARLAATASPNNRVPQRRVEQQERRYEEDFEDAERSSQPRVSLVAGGEGADPSLHVDGSREPTLSPGAMVGIGDGSDDAADEETAPAGLMTRPLGDSSEAGVASHGRRGSVDSMQRSAIDPGEQFVGQQSSAGVEGRRSGRPQGPADEGRRDLWQSERHENGPACLDAAVQLIISRETPAGLAFIETQADAYQAIFERAFPLLCPCSKHPTSEPQIDGERYFSAGELSAWLQRETSLGSLEETLDAESGTDCHAQPQGWRRFLARPPRALSLRRTEQTLPESGITVTRIWDVDSIWLGATNLGAAGRNTNFQLSLIPPFKQSIVGDQIIQPHGIDLGRTRHAFLGSFALGNLSFSVFMFFPKTHGATRTGSRAGVAKPLSLPPIRQRELVDGAILPAVRAVVPSIFRQEIPPTYDIAYAKRMSYQESPGNARWRASDESRAVHLRYGIQGRFLEALWTQVRQRCNELRVRRQGSETSFAYFEDPKLLFQVHDTKNRIAGETLSETLDAFCDQVLDNLQMQYLDFRSCWLDIGFRDMPGTYSDAEGQEVPVTLIWKSDCHDHYDRVLRDCSPEIGLKDERFRTFNLRDAATYTAKVRSSRRDPSPLDPGNPACTKTGVVRAKAYDCNKELFSVMYRGYQTFGSPHLAALALPDSMIQHLFSAGRSSATASQGSGAPSRCDLRQAWNANKRHLGAVYKNKDFAGCYAVRKETTYRLDVILHMHHHRLFSRQAAGGSTEAGAPIFATLRPAFEHDRHYPFWILPTKELNELMTSLACRLIKPLNYIFTLATHIAQHGGEARAVVYYYTAKLLTRLLLLSLTSEREYGFDKWIWEKSWTVRKREGAQRFTLTRTGLDVGATLLASGVPWLGSTQMDWMHSHLDLGLLQRVYIPRSPGHAAWAAQAVTQSFSRAAVASGFVVQTLLRRAKRCRSKGRNDAAHGFERCAARVAAQEIARSYQLHLLERLQLVWRNSVIEAHRSPQTFRKAFPSGPERLAALTEALRSTEEGTIVTAKDVSSIMREGLAVFEPRSETAADLREDLGPNPAEVPPWMSQRCRPSGAERSARWTEKVYQVLFQPTDGKRWARMKFMQDCEALRRAFDEARHRDCLPFDEWLKRTIGGFILVMFNSEKSKEVAISKGLAALPSFFRVQFWAPIYDHRSTSPDQPLDLRDKRATGALFSVLSETYQEQWLRLNSLSAWETEMPTLLELQRVMTRGDASDVRKLRDLTEDVQELLTMLFSTTNNWRLPREASDVEEDPWWSKESTVYRLLVPMERSAGGCPSVPTFLLPTRENVTWLKKAGQRLWALKPCVDLDLPGRGLNIDPRGWSLELRELSRLLRRADLLLRCSRALFLTELLERDLAYEFLHRGRRGLDEEQRLLGSFLMSAQPPQERQVMDHGSAIRNDSVEDDDDSYSGS
ncbi:hypothetical protein HIM_10814 [Hirsutella minnesotensis 3608]|uniref:Uncharacterized protein n=2 Tax=Hirsutella minnesotensis 3608 TaxID=1043627 RepID=A0A0F7ZFV4_9HYPO|nr:hypothetical protein HIM_10814 [Hirsutella minnesotensis 3608]